MTDKEFFDRAIEISTEFDRYVLSHPDIAEKIPDGALIVFLLKNDTEFNTKSLEIANKRREPNQPLVKVSMEKLLPPFETRLVNPQLELAVSI
ncbi:MAG: hypothetical protein Q7K21_04690 [Elusimicrobiota bacterium]|nr:hypothetical protein [Elusimicrobiota bacterium]